MLQELFLSVYELRTRITTNETHRYQPTERRNTEGWKADGDGCLLNDALLAFTSYL